MGVPDYVPNQAGIQQQYQGGTPAPKWTPGGAPHQGIWSADEWDAQQKFLAAQDATGAVSRNKNILGRTPPTMTDTSAYAQQVAAARANQLASMDNLRKSAMGQGPSYANAQAAIGLGQGINQLHSPQGNALAQRNMMLAGNQALGQLGAQGALARGTEMGNAMNAYGTGAQAIRGGDLAGQNAAAQQLAKQQALYLQAAKSNQGLVQGFEGLDMDRGLANTKDAQDWYNLWQQKNSATADQNMKETQAMIQTMAAAAAMAASDRRVKKEVR